MSKRIEVRDLNVYYSKFLAVEDVSLTIEPRTVTAFIGPSGCGKSTLLRTFNRMYELYPDQRAEGVVEFEGENLLQSKHDVALIRAKIGMVFQSFNLFQHMTVLDNVCVAQRKVLKRSKEEAENLAQQVLVATLTDADRWPAELGAQGIQGVATELEGALVG